MRFAVPDRGGDARPGPVNFIASVVALTALIFGALTPQAHAAESSRPLSEGDKGDDVEALQVRVAGWFPERDQRDLAENGFYGRRTTKAVMAFENHYGLEVDGAAGGKVFKILEELEDPDGSTEHFDWAEFVQNNNGRCSDAANRFAGTFRGGPLPADEVKANVQRLMWRLEALRAKSGDEAIGINSGFRSIPYNKCIGGASLSQHLYGTAADLRVAGTTNRHARDIARRSQFHGIGCYSEFTHNHLDIRLENADLPAAQYWWWPEQDAKGRDLAEDGKPCYGESPSVRVSASAARTDSWTLTKAGSFVPTAREVKDLEASGETLGWGD
ncbi:MAG: zinc D-Ala-D-Ala carboxypeptidase [Actinomycetota bacterium]|nr:zinc D-Ala-D-Ala carboxypeptidase [Actinomycetota bacterium]